VYWWVGPPEKRAVAQQMQMPRWDQIPKVRCLRLYREGGAREGDCSEKASEIWMVTVAVT
jgi:hypothetical protein